MLEPHSQVGRPDGADNTHKAAHRPPTELHRDPGHVAFETSVMLWTLGSDLSFEQRLERASAAGYTAAELVGEYASWSEDDFARHNARRRELGITFDCTASAMVAPGRSRHNASDPRQRSDFLADVRAELAMMGKVDCREMIVMAGEFVPGISPRLQRDCCVEALRAAADLAELEGVTILVENIDLDENPHYLTRSVEDTFQLVTEVDHPRVKVCYDLYHAQVSGGNLIANLERHFDLVGKVHIGDVPGHHEPGTGEINFPNIYRRLGELGYEGYVAMEFMPLGDPEPTLATARWAAEHAAEHWPRR